MCSLHACERRQSSGTNWIVGKSKVAVSVSHDAWPDTISPQGTDSIGGLILVTVASAVILVCVSLHGFHHAAILRRRYDEAYRLRAHCEYSGSRYHAAEIRNTRSMSGGPQGFDSLSTG